MLRLIVIFAAVFVLFKPALADELDSALKTSDHYQQYSAVFRSASLELISAGKCTVRDFVDLGGWYKSAATDGPVYFSYCGGMTVNNRVYLNAESGKMHGKLVD